MIEWSRRSVLLGIGGAIGSVVFPTAGMAAQNGSFGVVIYGATPSGIMAAYAADREGVSVALVLAGPIGGMSAQGLGRTDTGKIGVLGGLCMESSGASGSSTIRHRQTSSRTSNPIRLRTYL
jgi:hypothetical protein